MNRGLGHAFGRVVWLALALLLGACGSNIDAPWLGSRSGTGSVARIQGAPPSSVIVQRGDTVYAISRRYGVPMKGIIQANGLRPPYTLYVGQRLSLPRPRAHVVQRGDTLSGIARAYGAEMREIAALNGLRPPYLIRVGERLSLPDASSAVQVATSTSPKPSASGSRVAPKPAPSAARAPAPPPRAGKAFAWPARGRVIAEFGPTGKGGERNDGINIAVSPGTPVKAAENGVVVYAGNELKGFGKLLLVKHDGGWVTAYAHNHTLLAKRGQKVARGEVIAKAGQTGNVTTPQVHFEVRRGSRAVDPMAYLEQAVAAR